MGQRYEEAGDGRAPAEAQGPQGPAHPALAALPHDARRGRHRRRAKDAQRARYLLRTLITHQDILPWPHESLVRRT